MSVYLDTSNVFSIVCHFCLVVSTTNGSSNKTPENRRKSISELFTQQKAHIWQLMVAVQQMNISRPVVWLYLWHIFNAQCVCLFIQEINRISLIFCVDSTNERKTQSHEIIKKMLCEIKLRNWITWKSIHRNWISVNQCMDSEWLLQHTPVWVSQVYERGKIIKKRKESLEIY